MTRELSTALEDRATEASILLIDDDTELCALMRVLLPKRIRLEGVRTAGVAAAPSRQP